MLFITLIQFEQLLVVSKQGLVKQSVLPFTHYVHYVFDMQEEQYGGHNKQLYNTLFMYATKTIYLPALQEEHLYFDMHVAQCS